MRSLRTGAQLVAPVQPVPDAGELVAGVRIERLQPGRFLEFRRGLFQPAEVRKGKPQPIPGAVDARVNFDGALEARHRRLVASGALQDKRYVEVRGCIGRVEGERALKGVDRRRKLLSLGEQEGDAGPCLVVAWFSRATARNTSSAREWRLRSIRNCPYQKRSDGRRGSRSAIHLILRCTMTASRRTPAMKKIEAIVKPFKLDEVREALSRLVSPALP